MKEREGEGCGQRQKERDREREGEWEEGAKVITTQREFWFSRLKNSLSTRVGSKL